MGGESYTKSNTYSLQDVARELGAALSTLYLRRQVGQLQHPAARVGTKLRYSREQLEQIRVYWAANKPPVIKKESE